MAVWATMMLQSLAVDTRIDAEYYTHPGFQLSLKFKNGGVSFNDAFPRVVHPAEFTRGYQERPGHLFLRAQNIRPGLVDITDPLYVSESVYASLPNAVARAGDLLVVRTGANHGDVACVPRELDGVLVSSHTLRLVPGTTTPVHALGFFFASAKGRSLLHSLRSGGTHGQINGVALKSLHLPDLAHLEPESKRIAEIIEAKRQEVKGLYTAAEAILHEALGLDDLDLTTRLYYESSFSASAAASRLDAEYFNPEKREVLAALTRMQGQPIREKFRSIRKLWQPNCANPSDQVRNYDLTDALSPFLDDSVESTTADQIGSTKKTFAPGDLVISRLRSYLKEIAVVLPSGDTPLVGSSEFIILRPIQKTFSVEALLVYLRSPYVQAILKWCQDGSNHPRFDEKELLAIPIPDKIATIQEQLKAKVKDAIAARREARRLLARAKRAVEIAIDKNVSAAQQFLLEERG